MQVNVLNRSTGTFLKLSGNIHTHVPSHSLLSLCFLTNLARTTCRLLAVVRPTDLQHLVELDVLFVTMSPPLALNCPNVLTRQRMFPLGMTCFKNRTQELPLRSYPLVTMLGEMDLIGVTLPGTKCALCLHALPKHRRILWSSMTILLVYPVVACLLSPRHTEVNSFYPVCR